MNNFINDPSYQLYRMSPKILNKYYYQRYFFDPSHYYSNKFLHKRLTESYNEKVKTIQYYISGNTYYNKDYNDNHKYNYLRDKINAKKNK